MLLKYKNILFVTIVLLLFLISYARDTLFILLNACINHEPDNYANTPIPAFLLKLSISELKQLKWALAVVFSVLFAIISTGSIHLYFQNKQYIRLTIYVYIVLGVCTLISEFINHLFKLPRSFFNVIHAPETIIQSPLVPLLLFAVFILQPGKNTNTNS